MPTASYCWLRPLLPVLMMVAVSLSSVAVASSHQASDRSVGGRAQREQETTSRDTRFAHLQQAGSSTTVDDADGGVGDDDTEDGSVDAHSSSSLDDHRHHGRTHHHSSSGSGVRNRNYRGGRPLRARGDRPHDAVGEEDMAPSHSCPRCELHEEYKRMRLEAIKAEILSRLNLKEPPKMSNKTLPQNPTISSLIDRFEMAGDAPYEYDGGRSTYEEDDSYHVKPLEILLMATKPPANKTTNETSVCYFELTSDVRDAKSIKAQFGVYIKPSKWPSSRQVRTTLLRIHKLERRNGNVVPKTVHQRQLALDTESTGRWYRFSMDRIVKSWKQHPSNNLGLQVEAYDFDGTLLAIVQTDNAQDEPYKPYLEVQVKGTSRPKRHLPAPDCTARSKEKRCCRYPLIVDFVAMKWDWILAPKQYKAYYCYGTCPFAYYRPYPHTHVVTQTLVSDFTPCCTASELKPLLLFYRNQEQTIIYGRIPGMIVESCSCI